MFSNDVIFKDANIFCIQFDFTYRTVAHFYSVSALNGLAIMPMEVTTTPINNKLILLLMFIKIHNHVP